MHIEPGIVEAAKLPLSYATAVLSAAVIGRAALTPFSGLHREGLAALAVRSLLAALVVLFCFEVLPHRPVGVSEVHLILGSSLYLLFGLMPAAFGLGAGLLVQGVFFAPFDLPQLGMNLTTLLASLFVLHQVAGKVVPRGTAYVDLGYTQVLKLSAAFQGSIVAWVAFWVFFGQGVTKVSLASTALFGAAYLSVILIEPLIDLALLAAAKTLHALQGTPFITPRLYRADAR